MKEGKGKKDAVEGIREGNKNKLLSQRDAANAQSYPGMENSGQGCICFC